MPIDFIRLYDEWFFEVARWVVPLGGNDSEVEDIVQEVFLVARQKLSRFDGRNLGGWLYAITARVVANHRRGAWFRHLFLRREPGALERLCDKGHSPATLLEQKELRQIFDRLLARMGAKRRRAFELFEIEGLSGEEIARLEGVSVAAIWLRLHRARRDFMALVADLHQEGMF